MRANEILPNVKKALLIGLTAWILVLLLFVCISAMDSFTAKFLGSIAWQLFYFSFQFGTLIFTFGFCVISMFFFETIVSEKAERTIKNATILAGMAFIVVGLVAGMAFLLISPVPFSKHTSNQGYPPEIVEQLRDARLAMQAHEIANRMVLDMDGTKGEREKRIFAYLLNRSYPAGIAKEAANNSVSWMGRYQAAYPNIFRGFAGDTEKILFQEFLAAGLEPEKTQIINQTDTIVTIVVTYDIPTDPGLIEAIGKQVDAIENNRAIIIQSKLKANAQRNASFQRIASPNMTGLCFSWGIFHARKNASTY